MVRLVSLERVQWIGEQMDKVFAGKEDFLTETRELRMQLEKIPTRLDPCRCLTDQIVADGGDREVMPLPSNSD